MHITGVVEQDGNLEEGGVLLPSHPTLTLRADLIIHTEGRPALGNNFKLQHFLHLTQSKCGTHLFVTSLTHKVTCCASCCTKSLSMQITRLRLMQHIICTDPLQFYANNHNVKSTKRTKLTLPQEQASTSCKSSPSRGPLLSVAFSPTASSPCLLFNRHSRFFSLLASFSSCRLSDGSLLLENFSSSWMSSLKEQEEEADEAGTSAFLCLHLRFLSSRPSPALSLSSSIAALLLSSFLRLSRSLDLRFSVSCQNIHRLWKILDAPASCRGRGCRFCPDS